MHVKADQEERILFLSFALFIALKMLKFIIIIIIIIIIILSCVSDNLLLKNRERLYKLNFFNVCSHIDIIPTNYNC
jgi:hypothetical protein